MRTVKLLSLILLSITSVTIVGHRFLSGFDATAQSSSALLAPTGVSASDNSYATKVGINWSPVAGATTYRIFRNSVNDPSTATNIGSTPADAFFDTTSAPGQTNFYWVRAENMIVNGPLSTPDQGTRANGTFIGPVLPLEPPPVPPGNPLTAAKAALGKALFWDEQLSSTRTVACGTCHFAGNGGSESRALLTKSINPGPDSVQGNGDDVFGSPGVPSNNQDGTYNWSPTYGFREQVTGRKSRSYINAGYSPTLFWDGRAVGTFTDPVSGAVVIPNGAALESQVLGPPVSATEMAHNLRDWNDVAARVSISRPLAMSPQIPTGLKDWIGGRSYLELFEEAFGTPSVTPARIALAIATFERTLYSDRTPFDLSVAQITPLTAAEARGQGVFNGPGRCNTCHTGTLFSDNQFHNIGLRPQTEDTGRFQVTGNPANMGEFRTPSLRNVELRAPYMHTGRLATLEDVVDFYNRGGDFDATNIDRNRIRPLGLSPQQRADLVAFLRRPLTDPRVAAGTAPFDRPVLYSESARVPQVIGTGTTGSGGNIPQVVAIEPPIVGNPSLTFAVFNALGGSQAVLVIDTADPGTGPAIPATASLARVQTQLSGSGAGEGRGSISLEIPDTIALNGASFFGRWFISDPAGANGLAVSPAFKITFFSAAVTGATNPIHDVEFFVQQQYLDFLGRAPDQVGFQNWISTLAGCPEGGFGTSNPGCDRVHVSMGFFQSEEFLGRGYFAFRFYMTAFGQRPAYAQFVPDMQQVGGPKSPAEEEVAKTAFSEAFVQRSEFVQRYGSTFNDPTAYVDALLQTAGVPNLSIRDSLIAGLQQGTKTRGRVLREIIQTQTVLDRFLIEGFVAIQYFGYLRRDPDTIGYNNWVTTLRANPSDLRHMVFGFIYSDEYRTRFGQP